MFCVAGRQFGNGDETGRNDGRSAHPRREDWGMTIDDLNFGTPLDRGRTHGHSSRQIEFLVSHRMNSVASGVARFNELLATHLSVPVVALFGAHLPRSGTPLLSFKVNELSDVEREALEAVLDDTAWSASRVFLHNWAGTDVEERIVREADIVYCGNHEVEFQVRHLTNRAVHAWTPGLILDDRPFEPVELSVFTFGMAHKLRGDMFARLRSLLDQTGASWAMYVSSANHETSSLRDGQTVYEEISRLVPAGLFFLGHLADVAVFNYIRQTTFFATFFERGVRANNTSVAAAMEHGAVVITNLDEYSPGEYVHMRNIIDINKCEELPSDPAVLDAIGAQARMCTLQRRFPDLARVLSAGVPPA
jgi:hypothetical protein